MGWECQKYYISERQVLPEIKGLLLVCLFAFSLLYHTFRTALIFSYFFLLTEVNYPRSSFQQRYPVNMTRGCVNSYYPTLFFLPTYNLQEPNNEWI